MELIDIRYDEHKTRSIKDIQKKRRVAPNSWKISVVGINVKRT